MARDQIDRNRDLVELAMHASDIEWIAGAGRLFIGCGPLEDLADHRIEQAERLTRELRVQPFSLWRRDVVR
jgi:hypothetical protein